MSSPSYLATTFLHLSDSAEPVQVPGVLPLVRDSRLSLEGHAYRVRHTWFVLGRHGRLDDGFHVYLEQTDEEPPD